MDFVTNAAHKWAKELVSMQKKTKAGAYLTSPIYEFRTKCCICSDNEFVIRTNPKKQSFDFVSGIHMRAHELDFIEEENKKESRASEERSKKSILSQIETTAGGKRKALTEHDALQALIKINGETFGEDVSCNRKIRSSFRQDRREKKSRLKGAASLGWKEGMELLSEEREEDIVKAKSTIFSNGKKKEVSNFRKLRTSSIFSSKGKRKSTIEKSSTPEVVTSISTPDEVTSLGNTASSCEVQSTDSHSTQSNARILSKERKILVLQHSRKGGKISVDTVPSSFMFAALSGYGSDSE